MNHDERLVALARDFKHDNPALRVLVYSGAVWFEDGEKHLGVYSLTIATGGPVVCCIEDLPGGGGRYTPLHALAVEMSADALEITE